MNSAPTDPHQASPEVMEQALRLLRQAAADGNPEAQYRLGVMYANAEGVALDYVEAARWIGHAATKGHPQAQSILAWLYASGFGVAQDDAEAGRWYVRAAEQGNAKDQYTVAAMYRWGRYGVEKDPEKMVAWYQRAANQGFAPAQYALGQLLAAGDGVVRDVVTAFQWLSLAMVNGSEQAGKALGVLTREMTPAQIETAKRQMLEIAGHQTQPTGTGHML